MQIGHEHICVAIQFQGHRSKVKVTAAEKNGSAQVRAAVGHGVML